AFGEELLVPEYRGDGRAKLVCTDAEERDIRIRAALALRRMPVLRGGVVQAAFIRAAMCPDDTADPSGPPAGPRGTPSARYAPAGAAKSSGASDSGGAAGRMLTSARSAVAVSASSAYSGASLRIRWSCLRRRPNATRARLRTSRS